MNRKDTIIIAVLINAGLLALLFMMAINTDEEIITNQPSLTQDLAINQSAPQQTIIALAPPQTPATVVSSPSKVIAVANSVDEMDNFLKDLSTNNLVQSPYIDDEPPVELETEVVQAVPFERAGDANTASDTRIVEVTVKRGDALEKIARSNGTTVEVIKKINNLSSSKLNIGQVLRIPIPVSTTSTQPAKSSATVASNSTNTPKPSENVSSEAVYYTIKSGDNPWKIAKEHKVKYDDILKWNGMDEEKARSLKVGDKIRVK